MGGVISRTSNRRLSESETERILGKRLKEHTNGSHPSSVVHEHIDLTGHRLSFDHVKMLCKEDKTRGRVKETIQIYKDGPTLNRDNGREIPPYFSEMLLHEGETT